MAGPAKKIIDFWRAVEMFDPPSIPAVDRSHPQYVADVVPGKPLPWHPEHELRRTQKLNHKQTWRHVIYIGVHRRAEVFGALRDVFPPDPDSYERPVSGSSALLTFVLTEDGTLLKGSSVLSACVWAMGRALKPGPSSPGWLDGFSGLDSEFGKNLEAQWLPNEEDGKVLPGVFDEQALWDCVTGAASALGVDGRLDVHGVRIRSIIVKRDGADAVGGDFLNSFIADDLSRVSAAAARDEIGTALRDYLRPGASIDRERRLDVRLALDNVRRATDPDRIPLGRWPTAPDRPLALGQQLAVNETIALPEGDDRLIAVNGPPGTGKTTMLRELFAALVTQRAERLAELSDPSDAFVDADEDRDRFRWEAGAYRRVVRRLRPELTGFEMVVASSNNGAVENITRDIPAAGAIDPHWKERARDIDGLQVLAGLMVDPGSGAIDAADRPAWGLVAAPLGKSENRSAFVRRVWWTKDWKEGEDPPPKPPPGLRDLLSGWSTRRDPVAWKEAVANFERARSRVTMIRDDRLAVAAAADRLVETEPQLEAAREVERIARDRVIESRPRRDALVAESRSAEGERSRLAEALKAHEAERPFVLWFWARGAWRAREEELVAEAAEAEARLERLAADLRPLEAEVDAYDEARTAVALIAAAVEEDGAIVSRYLALPGAVLPDAAWYADRTQRELRAPWSDVELNEARTELFLAALDLHRAFLVGAAGEMREALAGAMDILTGAAPSDLGGDAALAAWQALFLVVPVLSTTFASAGRLLGRVGAEALGWLLIDEAGQATPQNAVGALWRCRRVVVVGDPLQLEPITTVPLRLEDALREYYGVDEEWLPSAGSAQTVADRLNRFGTSLAGVDGPVWVGAPLSVHRRCDPPMFGISNEIAYDGLMIDATDPALGEEFADRYPDLPLSKWIDVRSETSAGNWIPAEGIEVDRVLGYLAGVEFDFGKVIAIGPFRDVARQLSRRAARYEGLRAGTIHTAQGREADIVLLVLGSAPDREGARRWAASKPNLLNVAVSRARRRLYVIGDRSRWIDQRHFDLLGERLPHESRGDGRNRRPVDADS